MSRTTTSERAIEDAKLMLDGARQIFERSPTAINSDVVEQCEQHLNELLDSYPH